METIFSKAVLVLFYFKYVFIVLSFRNTQFKIESIFLVQNAMVERLVN